jgi:hypothetical protein
VVKLNFPGGPVPGNNSNQYSGVATVTFDYNPTIIRFIGNYTFERQRVLDGNDPTYDMFDQNRIPLEDVNNGIFGVKLTQILSPQAYIEVNASYIFDKGTTYDPQLGSNFLEYGDSLANYKAGVPWYLSNVESSNETTPQYTTPRPYSLFNTFSFASPNMPLIGVGSGYLNYNKYENDNLDITAALSDDISKMNSLKVGGELQVLTVRSYTPSIQLVNFAQSIADNNYKTYADLASMMVLAGVNNYGYDALGNSYSGTTNYGTAKIAPYQPIFGGLYVQDKMEYKNLILNAGLRFDYINTDNVTLKDPSNPQNVFDAKTGGVDNPSGLTKVAAFTSLSPRLGFSFPITDQTIFHTQYGKFVQQPSLAQLYEGPYTLGFWAKPSNGLFNQAPVGLDLRPTRTTQYEIGFTQQVGSIASFDITAFYKDIADQIVYGTQPVSPSSGWRPYGILTNGDYATTQGVELAFNMRRTQRFLVNGSISFSSAQGTGDNPYTNAGEIGAPINPNYAPFIPEYIVPLAFNHAVDGNLNIDYRFGKDDGPKILHDFGASLLFTFSSGHPYTLGITNGLTAVSTSNPNAPIAVDTRNRTALEAQNSSVTPSTFELDFRIDKTVYIMDKLSANIFIQVINILNTQNIEDVFTNTGSATDDGYLSSSSLGGVQRVQQYGQQFSNVYQAVDEQYAELYGTPRQIRLGVLLEY